MGWWPLLRREEGIAHEAAGDDRPLGESVAAEGGGAAVELGHRAHAHAAHLGPVLDPARLDALQQHAHVVCGDVVPDEHVGVEDVQLADQEVEQRALRRADLELEPGGG